MSADLLQLLFETTLAAGAATATVLGLRLPVRRGFGARAAYALWMLVPAAILAVLLPAPRLEIALPAATVRAAASAAQPMAAAPAMPVDLSGWLAAAWALGALALAGALALRQHRFRRALGNLRRQADGNWRADSRSAGPAVIGALRGRVVVPADFDERYTPLQRELVLRHERVHVARFDLAANLLASALRCLHWFNPLLHYAVARFRFDQELAADAVVLAQRPDARRDYAAAMLSTQLLADPPPLGCHWQPAHPLKERIMMLKQPLPGAWRTVLGATLVAGLSLGAGFAAWAAQPARTATTGLDDSTMVLRVTMSRDGEPKMVNETEARMGAQEFIMDDDGLAVAYKITQLSEGLITVSGEIAKEGRTLSNPSVQFRRDAPASIVVDRDAGLSQNVRLDFVYGRADELPARAQDETADASYARLAPMAYPAEVKAEKVAGTVLLSVQVSVDGKPGRIDVERSSGDVRLDDAAQTKVSEWRFNPARRDGKPVESSVLVPVTFELLGQDKPGAVIPPGALDEIFIIEG